MTNAERMRRYRARKKEPQQPRPPTVRERAQLRRISERTVYYANIASTGFDKNFWDNYVAGKYNDHIGNCIGVQFLAEVAQFGTVRAQQLVREAIEREGSAAARALWRKLIRRGKRYAELRRRREASAEYHRYYEKHGPRPLPWWLRDRP
jgi:hypothetical protein